MAKNSILSFFVLSVLGKGISVVFLLVIAKTLSLNAFGTFSLSMMVVLFFVSILVSSTLTPFVVLAGEESQQTGKINKSFSVQIIFIVAALTISFLLIFALQKPIMAFTQIGKSELFPLILCYIGITLKEFFSNLLLALNKKKAYAALDTAFGTLKVVGLFAIIHIKALTILDIFLLYFVASVISCLCLIPSLSTRELLPFKLNKGHLIKAFDFTKWQILGLTAVYFINWGDNLVLRPFVGLDDIGVYNLSYQFFLWIIALVYLVNTYYLPIVSRSIISKQAIGNYLRNARRGILPIGLMLGIIIYVISPYAIDILYDQKYIEAVTVFRILLVGALFQLYSIFYLPIINSVGRYKFLQSLNVIHIVLNILLNLILIPHYGILGAAIATTLSYIIKTIIMELYMLRYLRHYSLFSSQ